jgi:hypothetical protein
MKKSGVDMDTVSEILRYTAADRGEVFAFLEAVHSPEFSKRLQRQWDWKYDANPFNRGAQPYVLLWRDGGQIVGMLGVMPVRVCIDGTEYVVGHPCDWAMRRDHRGRRMARRLLDRQRPDWPMRFSWQNEISRKLSPGMIGENSGILRLAPMAKPLAAGDIIERASGSRLLGRFADAVARGMRPLRRLLNRRANVPGSIVSETRVFDDRFDRFWQRVRRDYPVMVVRDQRYLQWRFALRPDAQYRTLVATRGTEVLGYLVVRTVEQDGARMGYVVDFLVAERSTAIFSLLLAHAIAGLAADGARWMTCRATVPPFRRMLYRHGFLPVPRSTGGYLRTYRQETDSPDRTALLFESPGNWFLTMGDGDLEMSV